MTALKYEIYDKNRLVTTVSTLKEAKACEAKGLKCKAVYITLPSNYLENKNKKVVDKQKKA